MDETRLGTHFIDICLCLKCTVWELDLHDMNTKLMKVKDGPNYVKAPKKVFQTVMDGRKFFCILLSDEWRGGKQ